VSDDDSHPYVMNEWYPSTALHAPRQHSTLDGGDDLRYGLLAPSEVLVHATQVLATGHEDIAGRAPGGAPRVLHNPIRRGVTNSQDGVVDLGATRAGEHTRVVRLEATRGIHAHGHRERA